jgi:hypothetical protein
VTRHANAVSTRSTVRGPRLSDRHGLQKSCSASGSLSGGGATVRQGGDSPNGPLPRSSDSGVFSDPKAGAAVTLANPAVRVPFPGARTRKEHRGRPIQCPRFSQPQVWAARACSSAPISSGSGVRRLAVSSFRPTGPASVDRHHDRYSASTQGLEQVAGRDPESVMPTTSSRNLSQPAPVGLAGDRSLTDGVGAPLRVDNLPSPGARAVGICSPSVSFRAQSTSASASATFGARA